MDTKFNDVEMVILYKYLQNFRSSNLIFRYQAKISTSFFK